MSGAFDLDAALTQLRGRGPALVLMHDNPDPDSMAGAEALRQLLQHEAGLEVTVARGGIIGRAENRAMVNALGLAHVHVSSVDFDAFPTIALIDTQPETGNNSLPPGHRVDIVVDHHPIRPSARRAWWCDIREDFGASSTIAYSYLVQRLVPVPELLATALLYAIKTETKDLGREASENEVRAYMQLIGKADHELLHQIAEPKVPAAHFATLDRALRAAEVRGPLVAVNLGVLTYPDLVAEMADLLLPYERAHWVMCVGQHQGTVYLSLRTDVSDGHAGHKIRQLVGKDGAAGGHGQVAGGRLHAKVLSDGDLQAVYESLVDTFARDLGLDGETPRPLLG